MSKFKTWDSVNGKAKVLYYTSLEGQPRVAVQYDNLPYPELVHPDNLDQRIENDVLRFNSRANKASSIPEGQEKIEKFLKNLSPLGKAKAAQALDRQVRNKGRFLSRRSLVEEAISGGATLATVLGETVLQFPSGSYFSRKEITKTGMDYAVFLLKG